MGVTVAFQGRIVPTGARDKDARHEGHPGTLTADLLHPLAYDPRWQKRPGRLLVEDALADTGVAVLDALPRPGGPPLVILLMIGTNDLGNAGGVASTLEDLRRIVNKLNARYDNRACIALASIPPLHCDSGWPGCWDKARDWGAYNARVRAIGDESRTDRIHYVPVAEGLPVQRSGGNRYALELRENYGDALHLNDKGYAAMAVVWADVVGKIGKRVQRGTPDPCKGPLD